MDDGARLIRVVVQHATICECGAWTVAEPEGEKKEFLSDHQITNGKNTTLGDTNIFSHRRNS